MFGILSEQDCARIHAAGLEILATVGIRIHDPSWKARLLEGGARPDEKDDTRFYIGEDMVRRALETCPTSFCIKDRSGRGVEVKNGARTLYYTSNGMNYQRYGQRTCAPITRRTLADFVRVADTLKNVDGLVGTAIDDVAPQHRDFVGFKLMAQHSTKHLRPCIYTPTGAKVILEMTDILLDGKPYRDNAFFTLGYSCVSPLTWSRTALELFEATAGHGIAMMINSEPMAGGTSPVTLAGSLALADAEVLSGIVLNQLVEPGRPCIYNAGFAHVLDMRTLLTLTGAPENALLQAAGAQMAAFHHLPSAGWPLSDSAMLDGQAVYEKFGMLMAHTLSGVNMAWGMGNIETSRTISPEALVIDDEMAGWIGRFHRGIAVDEQHLAVDVIREMGFGAAYLECDHTLDFYREEIRYPTLPNRFPRKGWEDRGSRSLEESAAAYVDGVLQKPAESTLSPGQLEKLDRLEAHWLEKL
nr:trimethylamine methyltransferase family protein [bacterium]